MPFCESAELTKEERSEERAEEGIGKGEEGGVGADAHAGGRDMLTTLLVGARKSGRTSPIANT